MSTDLTHSKKESKSTELEKYLRGNQQSLQTAHPNYNIEHLINSALHAVRKNPDLRACTTRSLFLCAYEAAMSGLELNTDAQQAWLIKRRIKTEVPSAIPGGPPEIQYIPTAVLMAGYRGLMRIARRDNPWIHDIGVEKICENDTFRVNRFAGPGEQPITHLWNSNDRGKTLGYYAWYETDQGKINFVHLEMKDIEEIKGCAETLKVWTKFPDEMGKKSALRRLCKLIPRGGSRLDTMIQLDSIQEVGKAQNFDHILEQPGIILPSSNSDDRANTGQTAEKMDALEAKVIG